MTQQEKRRIIDTHVITSSRVNFIIKAGFISVPEVEQYSLCDDPLLFLQWAKTQWQRFWAIEDRKSAEMMRQHDAEFAELMKEIRPKLAAHIKSKYGSWAGYLESPEGKAATAEADAIAEKYIIKSPAECAAEWRKRREQ